MSNLKIKPSSFFAVGCLLIVGPMILAGAVMLGLIMAALLS